MNKSGRLSQLRSMIKLKQQEEIIESSIESFLKTMKVEFDVLQDILQTRRSNNTQKKKLTDPLRNFMSDIASDFDTIDKMINQFNECGLIDVQECKSRLTSLSRRMNDFQPPVDIKMLEKEQKELDNFLYEFVVSMEKYERKKSGKFTGIGGHVAMGKINNSGFNYDDVKDFNDLIVKTGHYGNWKEEDHIYFLKIRQKCQTIPSIVVEIQKKFPDLSAENIVNHEAWYKIYLELREKQRNSVKTWKKNKELEKKQKLDAVKLEGICDDGNCKKDDVKLRESKKAVNKKISKNSGKYFGSNETEKKELIKKWKTERENAKIAEKEEAKNQLKSEKDWREKKFILRSMEIKLSVKKYREEKAMKINTINSKSKKILKSPELIKSFRQDDEKYLQKRINFLKLKNNTNKFEKKNLCFKENRESTFLNATKIWEEKCKPENKKSSHTFKPVFYIKDLPKS